jgi:phytol kinase
MLVLLLTIPFIVLLLASTYLATKRIVSNEEIRKFVHIISGGYFSIVAVAFDLQTTFYLACIVLAALLISRSINLFGYLHKINRKSYGDILYVFTIGIMALMIGQTWVFVTSVMFMAIADAAAAVVGSRWGDNRLLLYRPYYGLKKSWPGTLAFMISGYVILIVAFLIQGVVYDNAMLYVLVGLPLSTAFIELFSPWGLDNVTVPVFVAIALQSIA